MTTNRPQLSIRILFMLLAPALTLCLVSCSRDATTTGTTAAETETSTGAIPTTSETSAAPATSEASTKAATAASPASTPANLSTQAALWERVAYLGPEGTHSEAAALWYGTVLGAEAELVSYDTNADVVNAVANGEVDCCLVAVENSLEGPVNEVHDALAAADNLQVTGEVLWPVHNSLMSKVPADNIKVIYSHEQALSQCKTYLEATYPDAQLVSASSTAEAARLASEAQKDDGAAAICTQRAGELTGLTSIASSIEDNQNNATRFYQLCRSEDVSGQTLQGQKAAIVCQLESSRQNAIVDCLGSLDDLEVERVYTRPARTVLGDYRYFIDVRSKGEDGEQTEQDSHEAQGTTLDAAAIEERLSGSCDSLRVLGPFPVLDAGTTTTELSNFTQHTE